MTVEEYPLTHLLFWCANLTLWVNLIRTHSTDPGLLQRNTDEYSEKIKQVARFEKWNDNDDNPLSRLCHTCRCVKVKLREPSSDHFCPQNGQEWRKLAT